MPKLKTNKGAQKRFRVTKNGKIKHGKSKRRHLLEWKSAKKNRSSRKAAYVHPSDEFHIRQLLPYS